NRQSTTDNRQPTTDNRLPTTTYLMKICPKCRQQFPNGFQYCPIDTEFLVASEEYLRRRRDVPPGRSNEPAQERRAEYVPIKNRASVNKPPVRQSAGLNFAMPEEGNLVARLLAGFKNIGYIFKGGPKVSVAGQGEFQFLLPDEPLPRRIGREVGNALVEFKRDPRQFMVSLVKGEGSNRVRRNALLAGSEMAFVGYFTVYFAATALGRMDKVNNPRIKWYFAGFAAYLAICYLTRGLILIKLINRATKVFAIPKVILELFSWGPLVAVVLLAYFLGNYSFYCMVFPDRCPMDMTPKEEIALLQLPPPEPEKVEVKLPEKPKVEKQQLGGSKPKPKPATGGGGGGKQQPTPPSKGVPPQMSLTPPIMPPSPEPPKIKNPQLVVAQTIYGDPKTIPTMKGPIGDPTGIPAPPSSGPGAGGGIGRGGGAGVGKGQGGGLGAGRGGNAGGGDMGLGGGGGVQPMTATLKPTILYLEKPRYTEEARQNRIQGSVVLSVIYGVDGRITGIRVVHGLPDGLTEKAIEAAQRIRFNPAVKHGVPVPVRGTLEFAFNLY
ncbi:MAG: energy transducer TonB, partial [Blastocatellia bacterium]|nr:energy transducer TonB [Blastocatellia bacterium]